ncbi:hypothetical protein [Leyella stercorea]|uniref:hypothetical protein n=1 Tax=Leyella stercorea TaxID=363265 RepID=UPI00242AE58C|nr:hypothetical protein [Leyella stercorea]
MIYQVDNIVRDVRIVIDENASSAPLILDGDSDTLTLDEIIKSKIVDAVKKVEMDAPTRLLESGFNIEGIGYWKEGNTGNEVLNRNTVYWENDLSGWMILPEDFMRLLVFRMSDWEKSVYTPIGITDEAYNLQSCPFTGIRGNTEKPVCAIVLRSVGLTLEFYSCTSKDATVEQAVYLPIPVIKNNGIYICKKCYSSIVYYIAALTELSIGNVDAARLFSDLSARFLL